MILSLKPSFLIRAQESQTGIVDLPENEGVAIKSMIQFLYTGKYDKVVLEDHVKIYIIADKYDLPALRCLAGLDFEADADPTGEPEEFFKAVEYLYTQTGDCDLQFYAAALIKGLSLHLGKSAAANEHIARIPGLGTRIAFLYLGWLRDVPNISLILSSCQKKLSPAHNPRSNLY